jgi:Glycosyltransferase
MNVLFISSWYPTVENPNLGIFIKEHAKAIKTTSAEIRVLALVTFRSKSIFKCNFREYIDESGICTYELIIHSRYRDLLHHFVPFQNRLAYYYYKKCIAPEFSIDILHSNVIFPAGMIGNYFAQRLKKPHIITEHWSKIAGLLKKPYLSKQATKSYQNATRILPVSGFLKSNMMQLIPALSSGKFNVIPNIIDSKTFTYKEKVDLNDDVRLCAIATWATKKIPDKKPELFIDAISIINQQGLKKCRLTMVGGGDRVEELKAYCKARYIDADFVGYQSKENIATILQQSDYFIHASTIETFGVVVVEALMTGTPVICSQVGGLPELVDSSNGILCRNTVEDWVIGLKTIQEQTFDRKAIAEHVRDEYSLRKVGEKIFSVYEQIE